MGRWNRIAAAIKPDLATLCFCLLLLALTWGAGFWQIRQDRQETLNNITHDNEKFCLAFEEHVRRILHTNEHYLDMIKREYEAKHQITPMIHQFIEELTLDPVFAQLGIYSSEGKVLVSRYPFPADINMADLPHVQAHSEADSGQVFIGKPIVGRISHKLSIHMSRRLNHADGSFAGVALVAIDPAYFTKFYQDMNLEQYYVVRLIGLDGIVRASNTVSEVGLDASNSYLFSQLEQQTAGSYLSGGKIFNKHVYTSYRRMVHYPFVLQVGVDEKALVSLYQRRNGYIAAATVVSLFIILYSVSMIRSSRRLRSSESQLQASYDDLAAANEEVTATGEELRLQYESLLRMNEQVTRQNTILSLVQETAGIILNKLDMDQLLHTIVTQAAAMVGVNDAFIVLPSADKQCLHVRAGIGIYSRGNIVTVPFEGSLAGKVYRTGQMEYVEDFQNWEGLIKVPLAENISALLAAPLYAKEHVAGVFGVASCCPALKFDSDQMELLSRFAELASLALENASLHTSLQAELEKRNVIAEELAHIQAERQAVMDAIPDAMLTVDQGGHFLSIRRPHNDFGPFIDQNNDLIGWSVSEILPSSIAGDCLEYIQQTIETGLTRSREYSVQINGEERYWDVRFSRIGPSKSLIMIRDITGMRRSQEQVEYLSLHDPLTAVYNRTYFEGAMVNLTQQAVCGVAIVVCDVDGLKLINDTLGHHAGDDLLRAVAATLKASLISAEDFVARIGGDEFAVVLHNPDKTRIEATVLNIRQQIEVYNAKNQHLPVSLSIGWAADYGSCMQVDEIFKQADNEMYRQKMHQRQSMRSAIVETMMKALEARDFITEGHADRLGEYAEQLGRKMDLPAGRLADLRLLAKFHDIGKVGIPDSILNKPGKLDASELTIMRRHSEIGCRIALASPDLAPIADWILKHQEWWDGGGYPLGIKADQIPLECRILALVDAYDAMTNDRPYRSALSHEDALQEIKRFAGAQFDPVLAEIFIQMVSEQKQAL